jgi:hypothetical protein
MYGRGERQGLNGVNPAVQIRMLVRNDSSLAGQG